MAAATTLRMATPPSRLILIVEDDPPIAEILASAIGEERGHTALLGGSADEALAALGSLAPALVVLGIRRPGTSRAGACYPHNKDPRGPSVPAIVPNAGEH